MIIFLAPPTTYNLIGQKVKKKKCLMSLGAFLKLRKLRCDQEEAANGSGFKRDSFKCVLEVEKKQPTDSLGFFLVFCSNYKIRIWRIHWVSCLDTEEYWTGGYWIIISRKLINSWVIPHIQARSHCNPRTWIFNGKLLQPRFIKCCGQYFYTITAGSKLYLALICMRIMRITKWVEGELTKVRRPTEATVGGNKPWLRCWFKAAECENVA